MPDVTGNGSTVIVRLMNGIVVCSRAKNVC